MSPRSDATELVHPRNKPEADVHGKFSPIVIQRTNPLIGPLSPGSQILRRILYL